MVTYRSRLSLNSKQVRTETAMFGEHLRRSEAEAAGFVVEPLLKVWKDRSDSALTDTTSEQVAPFGQHLLADPAC